MNDGNDDADVAIPGHVSIAWAADGHEHQMLWLAG